MQGVGFRWYIQQRAAALGVAGWTRNLPGGRVEVVGAAGDLAMASLDEIVRQGPPGARVTAVTSDEVPHEIVDTKSFIIKR